MYNSHVHSSCSHDCKTSLEDMCIAAVAAGIKGFAVTDHCNLKTYISDNVYTRIRKSLTGARRQNNAYKGKLRIFAGIELGDILQRIEYARYIVKAFDYDVVLMSVHGVDINGTQNYMSRIDFSVFTDEEIIAIINGYFDELIETAQKADFDVCAHLTLPLRYTNGVFGRKIPAHLFEEKIKKVLSILIERGKALEVNTSEINHQLYNFMPDRHILQLYRSMGGRLVTIGTDAHTADGIATGFPEALKLLKNCGFDRYFYYENRNPVPVQI